MTVWHVSQIYQLVMIVLCALFLAIVGTQRENEITKNLLVTGFLIMFQNIGYLMLLSSDTMREAMIAVRIEYMGTAYLVTFMMMFVLQYCKKEMKQWIKVVLLVFDSFVLLGVLCCQFTKIYYSSLEFVPEPLPHLERGMGPLYIVASLHT